LEVRVRNWDGFLTEADRLVFERSGFGVLAGYGDRPVLLVVDVNYNFCGDRPLTVLESVEHWPNSCGLRAWTAVEHTEPLLAAARASGIPVFFTTGMPVGARDLESGRWLDKHPRAREDRSHARGNNIVDALAPRPHEVVLTKGKPSAFFGTLLESYLSDLRIDTIVVCGATTSGCIRATVVDAFSYNYKVAVVEECTFDRGEASHALSLFDMHQKYADVVSLKHAIGYLEGLPDDLFEHRVPSATLDNA
jgi:maleamate amidohydrolase